MASEISNASDAQLTAWQQSLARGMAGGWSQAEIDDLASEMARRSLEMNQPERGGGLTRNERMSRASGVINAGKQTPPQKPVDSRPLKQMTNAERANFYAGKYQNLKAVLGDNPSRAARDILDDIGANVAEFDAMVEGNNDNRRVPRPFNTEIDRAIRRLGYKAKADGTWESLSGDLSPRAQQLIDNYVAMHGRKPSASAIEKLRRNNP